MSDILLHLIIRLATMDDLPTVLRLRDQARDIMRSYGNTFQWPDGYPPDERFAKDIELGACHLISNENDETVATFTLLPSPEPTYDIIYDGHWLDDEPYHVIHRIASTPDSHGVLDAVLDYCVRHAAKLSVCKINIDSDLRLAMTGTIRQFFDEHPDKFDPREYLKPARANIKEIVRHKLRDVLGCAGKA